MEVFIGTVLGFAGSFAPAGWAYCDGQMMKIAENMALFSILGVTYGGDGKTTFALPKIAADAAGVKSIIALQGIFPPRS